MTTATTFVRQNDAGLRVRTSKYWQNLVLAVVFVLNLKVSKTRSRMTIATFSRQNDAGSRLHSIDKISSSLLSSS